MLYNKLARAVKLPAYIIKRQWKNTGLSTLQKFYFYELYTNRIISQAIEFHELELKYFVRL